ncbi:MAG: glycoside hydrolase domain-containing protein [Bacteroidales bacterium]
MKNKRNVLLVSILPALTFIIACGTSSKHNYSVANIPWEESLGNHRAVLNVEHPAEALSINLTWRRHDRKITNKRFVIIHEDGDTIQNIHRLRVDNEVCKLCFGPVRKMGTYYFYYLPYEVQKENGFYNKDYLKPENAPDGEWLRRLEKEDNIDSAYLLEFQARTDFDNFYPMEIVALKSEKEILKELSQTDFIIFPESRRDPIRMLDNIPQKWIQSGPSDIFEGDAKKNEYYTFQLGVWASQKDIEDLNVKFSTLKGDKMEISSSALTCFNTGGIDPCGTPFKKQINLKQGDVQPLWIGVDIPRKIASGEYKGEVIVAAKGCSAQTVNISINISEEVLADRGDSELWRHSRLRWLNSTLGIDNKPTKAYNPISVQGGNSFKFTGKTLAIGPDKFPSSINVNGVEMLSRPISFGVHADNRQEIFRITQDIEVLKDTEGLVQGAWESVSANFRLKAIGTIESDAHINYKVKLVALNPIVVHDIRLEIPIKREIAEYMMGMGLPGTSVPKKHSATWDGPHDSFWIGNTNAGIWCELRGGDYSGPLLNLYHPEYPKSWYNDNKGGFKIESSRNETRAVVYSGERNLKKGEVLEFEWSMLLTPVKDINYKSQFSDRYYHNGSKPSPSKNDFDAGVKIINVHHANEYNPHINYPFIGVDKMKTFVKYMHNKGQKVKIYNTVRELSNYTTEVWALRSLGHEILGDGKGGGYPWLQEHFVDDYNPQWYQWFPDKSADASIVNAYGGSRWYNYYIEGLRWLVENVDIDGLYLDDVSYDRRTLKRMRKVLDDTKSGCIMDLHSNTGFSKGPATQYAEFFPFIDKLWFGESFMYNEMSPENWLVEVSGIPFGLMGDMLHRGGNRWLGMVYGMTVRHPWETDGVICDPRPIWRIWDDFNIENAKMQGFWDKNPAIKCNNRNIKITTYILEGRALVAIGNWSEKSEKIKLEIDWNRLGIPSSEARLIVPEVQDFQSACEFAASDEITIASKKGYLILIE